MKRLFSRIQFWYFSDDDEEMSKTLSDAWTLLVFVGVNIFMVNGLAFETSISLLGLSSTISTIDENNEKKSEQT